MIKMNKLCIVSYPPPAGYMTATVKCTVDGGATYAVFQESVQEQPPYILHNDTDTPMYYGQVDLFVLYFLFFFISLFLSIVLSFSFFLSFFVLFSFFSFLYNLFFLLLSLCKSFSFLLLLSF